MFELEKINPAIYKIPKTGQMKVPGLLIANQKLLEEIEIEKPLEQVRNVACLPGIIGYSIAMPDIHWGYGFPIGGVAATDADEGVISPGGVGYDINCGVRMALIPFTFKELKEKERKKLIQELYRLIPSGVGKGHSHHALNDQDYKNLIEKGAQWSISKGFGFKEDLEAMESYGCISGADFKAVSELAKQRGKDQLGSVGSGNHFIEIGEIETIYHEEIAEVWGVKKGLTYALIHSGSRGFGYQICQEMLHLFIKKGYAENLPDRQLVAAPLHSPEGRLYFSAMNAAANYAFNNRQQMLHLLRQAFKNVLNIPQEDIRLIYDVCHNIAKFEVHEVDGKKKKLCVHRKGATRAFGPNHPELAPQFQKTGQPVLVPGDMGRASYLLAGLGNPLTWSSACHGAGRAKSRVQSMKHWQGKQPIKHMENQGILVMANSYKTIAEEMPDAYKDVDIVVRAVEEAALANRIARLKPSLVIKG